MTHLPPTLFTDEFAKCVRLGEETIRRKCRARIIKARGRPYQIPISELAKFDVSPEQALRILSSQEET